MKAVVLAAGKGTRMRAVSLGLPKILLPLGETTIGDNLISGLKDAGVSEILFIVGYMEKQVTRHFGDGASVGVSIHYVRQEKALGTGHAASLARDFVSGDPFFFVAYGDIATPAENCADLVGAFREHSPEAIISTYRVKDPSKGAAVYVEDGYMKRLVEKPARGASTTHFDNAGIYVFTPKVFEMLDRIGLSPRKEYELTDALTLLVEHGFKVKAHELSGFWSNVSSPEDLLGINMLVVDRLRKRHPPKPRKIVVGVAVSPLAVVSPDATLGQCDIGDYSIIAGRARIMDGARLRHAIVCQGAVVGEGAQLSRVLVRPRTVVEAGTVCGAPPEKVLILPDEIQSGNV